MRRDDFPDFSHPADVLHLTPRSRVDHAPFRLVRLIEDVVSENGKPYVQVQLRRADGEVVGFVPKPLLEALPDLTTLPMPDAVLVSGRMMCNRSVRYLHVFDLKPANALSPEWRLNLFDANGILDWSVFVGIRDLIFGLDEPYRRLLATILTTTAGQAFFAGPSSLHDHHHEAGGNARHALHVATLALGMLAECDALVDRNLVLALALLHDIGKTTEYEATQNGRWQMSSAGRLIGHRMSGLVAVAREIRQAGLSAEAELSLLHGLSACQAPKYVGLRGPASLEALIVGAADGVSRYMDLFSQSYRPGKSFGDRHPHLAERPHFPVVAVHRLAHHAS